ncbi:MAG: hypothetical protein Q7V15_02730 [Phenylobacterium sp.]|uniref:hypothetical protein n=1 Tax=Phenylobacterium sp. TaxID=1871053 RepID=UPI00271AE958|nr:hypothetical protein [Phenylobacterium sp.]MDO8900247.1 hypothetical protein [Phenylobacterium sp.]MDP2215479.1 hypothetical protein [Phenylobacterium sp.]
MTGFWRVWMAVWRLSVASFGLVLAAGAFEATSGPVRMIFDLVGEALPEEVSSPLRFSIALMGAVTLGWWLTLEAAFRAVDLLGDRAAPVWRGLTLSVVGWYLIDGALSAATGFGLNIIPNTVLLAGYLVPVLATGVMRRA